MHETAISDLHDKGLARREKESSKFYVSCTPPLSTLGPLTSLVIDRRGGSLSNRSKKANVMKCIEQVHRLDNSDMDITKDLHLAGVMQLLIDIQKS